MNIFILSPIKSLRPGQRSIRHELRHPWPIGASLTAVRTCARARERPGLIADMDRKDWAVLLALYRADQDTWYQYMQ